MSAITVAVLGATGLLGTPLIKGLTSPTYHPAQISKVIFFTRDPSSEKAKALQELGAEPVQVGEAVEDITPDLLKGVDVFISVVGSSASPASREAWVKAAAAADVKVYFPSEFGSDYSLSDVHHEIYDAKITHAKEARKLVRPSGGNLKVVVVSNAGFLAPLVLSPFFGFDFKAGVFTSWGDPNLRIGFTAIPDIVSSTAQLAISAAKDPGSIPDHVRIQGDAKSHVEIAEIASKESGQTIKLVGGAKDYEKIKADLVAKHDPNNPASDIYPYIRLLAASGAMDFTNNNSNELVNRGQSLWKWKTVTDFLKETKGRPDL